MSEMSRYFIVFDHSHHPVERSARLGQRRVDLIHHFIVIAVFVIQNKDVEKYI
jgi:hypothetical protein